ncbi:glycoside hydrolase 5 family protein [Saccharicrinis fermentans]|uniref:mannan endo-1,4-beta-mannosidase n=1 Tax=Saccharicrinis fermentans DSM 9555 = JCM 21142 TaxID=869213 RepID=W7XZM6_9BACT|nr:glycoside hydrolase family 2 TIM barrel-domain containing protein [Saccharicrinis fermentans]GAF04115.1 beta-D-glucuronidase [Saccharicrinis fermentans DSM 9555 = JCM 21142]
MKTYIYFLVLLFSVLGCQQADLSNKFVQVKDGSFLLNNKPYHFKGANYWQGMNLGAPKSGNQARLIRELDQMKAMGITNLRVLAASEADSSMRFAIHPALQTAPGVYNKDIWQGLDFLLEEMSKRDMKAVMVLGNFWTWSGGFPQYLKWAEDSTIPYPQEEAHSWDDFQRFSAEFYSSAKAQDMMNNHIQKVIMRVNSISGISYKNDPTIMAWQLANEPRGFNVPDKFRKWTRKTSEYIKSLDQNHLVCLGTEGNTSSKVAGVNALLDNGDPNIDYITMHIWAQNWGWFKPGDGEKVFEETLEKVDAYWNDHIKVAKQLNKPIVLEEFGIARDRSSYLPTTTTFWRDRYFSFLLKKVQKSIYNHEPVQGFNFWSYSGEGRPPRPGEYWKKGDVILGDPAHELQGWYGVYDTDSTTIGMIKELDLRILSNKK